MKSLVLILIVLISFMAAFAQLAPYVVQRDLSNVDNVAEFKSAIERFSYPERSFDLTEAQLDKLAQNAFVVVPADADQFFHIYESEHYGVRPRIPNFISTDCVLQLYHMLYDCTLKGIEVESLTPALEKLTAGLLEGSIHQYETLSDSLFDTATPQRSRKADMNRLVSRSERIAAAERNIAYFAVAARLLDLEIPPLPSDCMARVDSELVLIDGHADRASSPVLGTGHDYTLYAVRGHYTRTPALQAFFKTMMWYGTAAFPLPIRKTDPPEMLISPALMVSLLFEETGNGESLIQQWNRIYTITTLFVGRSDFITPHDLNRLINDSYGRDQRYDRICDLQMLNYWKSRLGELASSRIQHQAVNLPTSLQFRLMGQRYIPDSYMLQELSDFPTRPFPKGLDVMAVLGSDRAADLLDNFYNEPQNAEWYLPRRDSLLAEFSAYTQSDWQESLVGGWLYMLKALLKETDPDCPSFMQNQAWTDKQLNTSLASWAEMRHDVILYANPSYAEGGDGAEADTMPKGYVEPVPEFYSRLLAQLHYTERLLMAAGYLSDKTGNVYRNVADLVSFLHRVSLKELAGAPLTVEEYETIRWIGAKLEWMTLDILNIDRSLPVHDERTGERYEGDVDLGSWFQVTGPDRDVACIADIHTSGDHCLEEAVGHLDIIYVVVPIEGKLRLTRGGVFSYYEFTYPAAHRLNDEAWQEMIKRGRAPERPAWISSFRAE